MFLGGCVFDLLPLRSFLLKPNAEPVLLNSHPLTQYRISFPWLREEGLWKTTRVPKFLGNWIAIDLIDLLANERST